MSTPVEVPMSEKQRELWAILLAEVRESQSRLSVFCDTMFRGVGVTGARNVQLVDGKLFGEIHEPSVPA